MAKNKKKEELNVFNQTSMLIQIVCAIIIMLEAVLSVIDDSFSSCVQMLVGVTLMVMAYNNHKIYKRKYLTLVYTIFGLVSLTIGIINYVRVFS